jgi:putative SOS response-associated peptidase YedK
MCYYNGMRVTKMQYIKLLNLEKELKAISRPVQSGFDYRDWPVIKPINGSTDFEIKNMHWEYIPGTIYNVEQLKEARIMFTWLNAKSENLFVNEKGRISIYREGATRGRCLALSSYFFEWRHVPLIGKKGKPLKATQAIPYCITLKNPEQFFYMAAVSREWENTEMQQSADTFAIVTTEANELMEVIHNKKKRMPTILTEKLANAWLSNDLSKDDILSIASYQYNPDEMIAWPVAKNFIHAPDPTEPFEYENLPPL